MVRNKEHREENVPACCFARMIAAASSLDFASCEPDTCVASTLALCRQFYLGNNDVVNYLPGSCPSASLVSINVSKGAALRKLTFAAAAFACALSRSLSRWLPRDILLKFLYDTLGIRGVVVSSEGYSEGRIED
jgi:hypothetical protein